MTVVPCRTEPHAEGALEDKRDLVAQGLGDARAGTAVGNAMAESALPSSMGDRSVVASAALT